MTIQFCLSLLIAAPLLLFGDLAIAHPGSDPSSDDFAAGALHCAKAVSDAFAGLSDLVLVGHSIAGLFLPLVMLPVKRFVFLHTLLPCPGVSVLDQLKAEPDMFNPEMFKAKAPFWEDESVAREFLFRDCDPDVARCVSTSSTRTWCAGQGGHATAILA